MYSVFDTFKAPVFEGLILLLLHVGFSENRCWDWIWGVNYSLRVTPREKQGEAIKLQYRHHTNISPHNENLGSRYWESSWEEMAEPLHPHQTQAASGMVWLWTRLLSEAETDPGRSCLLTSQLAAGWAAQPSFKGVLVIFVSITVMFGSFHSCCLVNLYFVFFDSECSISSDL